MNNDGRNALDRVHRDIDVLLAVEEALLSMQGAGDTFLGIYHIVQEVRSDLEDASEHLTATDHPPNGGGASE